MPLISAEWKKTWDKSTRWASGTWILEKIEETETTVTETWRFMGPPEKEDGELAMEWGKMKACASRFEAIPERSRPIRGKKVVLQKQNKTAMLQKKKSKAVKAAMKKKAMLKKHNVAKLYNLAMKKKG